MGLSRSAKRGISILSHKQWKTKNWKYHVPAPRMIDLSTQKFDASIVQAGVDAISKMRENANAIQKLSEKENNPVADDAETRPLDGVRVQQKNGTEGTQGSDDSASGGAK